LPGEWDRVFSPNRLKGLVFRRFGGWTIARGLGRMRPAKVETLDQISRPLIGNGRRRRQLPGLVQHEIEFRAISRVGNWIV